MSSKKRTRAVEAVEAVPVAANRKRAPVNVAKDLDQVMLKCRQLKAALREKVDEDGPNGKVVPESIKSEEIVEVAELSATEVLEGIE